MGYLIYISLSGQTSQWKLKAPNHVENRKNCTSILRTTYIYILTVLFVFFSYDLMSAWSYILDIDHNTNLNQLTGLGIYLYRYNISSTYNIRQIKPTSNIIKVDLSVIYIIRSIDICSSFSTMRHVYADETMMMWALHSTLHFGY